MTQQAINCLVNPIMMCAMLDKKFTQSLFDLMYRKDVYVFNAQYSYLSMAHIYISSR